MKKILLAICTLFAASSLWANVEIKRVEPLHWWVGMQNSELQILIYGDNVGATSPEILYEGVSIKDVKKTDNSNYLFIYLNIAQNTSPGMFNIKLKQNKKTVAKYKYELKARNTNNNGNKGFDASDVVYLIMPDRFANGDPSNDNTAESIEKLNRTSPLGRHGGDIQGVMNHLDYIAKTGFTAIWLNPFLENNQSQFTYHGYAISDFYKVDQRHGTNKLFTELVSKAHQKGIKTIMDMVFNHCGSAHWFFNDPPSADWFNQHDEYTRSNFKASTIADPYASNYDKEKMVTGWFDKHMPDLNQKNQILATYLIQNTIWWIEFSGIDGIRVDTQPYPDKDFMADWSEAIMTQYPNFNIVGEAWLQKIPIAAYFQKDARNIDGYNSNMPSIMDFPLYFALTKAFNEEEGWTEGLSQLYYVLAQDFCYPNPDNLMIFPDNHDLTRFYESVEKDINKFKMGLAFILTVRGIPQIYYGTEILMDGKESDGHGYIRTDFPGGWPGDEKNAFKSEGRSDEQNKAYNYLSTILNWRKNCETIHKGKLVHFLPEDGIYVLFRYTEKSAVMIILNNNDTLDKKLNTNRFKEIIGKYSKGVEITSKQSINDLSVINAPAKSAIIIELKK